MRGLRVAILGTRGVPGSYGGFETFAKELGARLVDRGHEGTVYWRNAERPRPSSHGGKRLVHLPAIRHKYTGTISHTLISALHAVTRRYDVAIPWPVDDPILSNRDRHNPALRDAARTAAW